jgi:hypothetical protein
MADGPSAARAVVSVVAGVVLILVGAAIAVSSTGADRSLLLLLAGIAVAAVGAVLVGGNLRKGLVGDRSETCSGCMDPIVPGADRCPNCGHVYGR